jgi:2-polyprenyl-6-methoxyphenol hydroxylase-like FAD-dependent oxidoreductase
LIGIGPTLSQNDPVDGQGLSLMMRDVQQLSELPLATDDWTVAALRPYGHQRAERLRRMRRVSRTFAALMTTFTADGRARRSRFYAATQARQDDVRLALGAIHFGPDRLPNRGILRPTQRITVGLTSITEGLRLTESDNLRVTSWITRVHLNG